MAATMDMEQQQAEGAVPEDLVLVAAAAREAGTTVWIVRGLIKARLVTGYRQGRRVVVSVAAVREALRPRPIE